MVITRAMTGDMTLTIAGVSQLVYVTNCVASVPADLVEGRAVGYRGKNPQAVKQEMLIRTTQLSSIDSCTRTANVDISLLELGGVDFLTHLRGGSFRASHQMEEIGGIANFWKYNMPTIPDYGAELMLNIPNATTANAVRTFLGGFMNATIATAIAARNMTFEITINGVAINVPMICQDAQWTGEDGKQQIVTLSLQGKDCGTTYPTTPTGNTSLLEKAFTVPGTPVAVVFTPKSSNSTSFAGDFVFDTFNFNFNDASLITTDYAWRSHGVVAPTNN